MVTVVMDRLGVLFKFVSRKARADLFVSKEW
jgi:hypothetical protein